MKKESKIFDSEIKYTIDFRKVKYPRLEFRTGQLHLILPLNYKKEKSLLEKHKRWIKEKEKIIKKALIDSKKKKIKEKQLNELKKLILKYCRENKINLDKIYFRKMKSKWASCSIKKNLTFNTLLRYLPNFLIKYVAFHEITHLKEKKHNERFWKIIKKEFKDYQKKEKELLVYWFLIQKNNLK